MSDITIVTNNVPRFTLNGWELTAKELAEQKSIYDGTTLDAEEATYFRYRGQVYCLSDIMRLDNAPDAFKGWHGYHGDTYFSGILVKLVDAGEQVVIGRYYS